MKRLNLIAMLIVISINGKLMAQSSVSQLMSKSNTDITFNINENMVNIRDFVVLREGKMILELSNQDDYESFHNMDSLLRVFKKDISFYKDSLAANPTNHYRIDYVINPDFSFKKIRFKQYTSDGSIFVDQGGDVSKLKFEQDTINIIVQKSIPGMGRHKKDVPCTIPYSVKATFLLGNYYDVDRVIKDNSLKGIIDTLEKITKSKRTGYKVYSNPLSIVYNPYYTGSNSMQVYDRALSNEYDVMGVSRKSRPVSINASIGAGLVRNVVSPMADAGIEYKKYFNTSTLDHNFYRLSVSPYYFFDRNEASDYAVHTNWFVNASLGSIYTTNQPDWFGKQTSIGIGYLFVNQGNYFKNTTFKVFTNLQLNSSIITIMPEVIFTNNLKQIFPGITVTVF